MMKLMNLKETNLTAAGYRMRRSSRPRRPKPTHIFPARGRTPRSSDRSVPLIQRRFVVMSRHSQPPPERLARPLARLIYPLDSETLRGCSR